MRKGSGESFRSETLAREIRNETHSTPVYPGPHNRGCAESRSLRRSFWQIKSPTFRVELSAHAMCGGLQCDACHSTLPPTLCECGQQCYTDPRAGCSLGHHDQRVSPRHKAAASHHKAELPDALWTDEVLQAPRCLCCPLLADKLSGKVCC